MAENNTTKINTTKINMAEKYVEWRRNVVDGRLGKYSENCEKVSNGDDVRQIFIYLISVPFVIVLYIVLFILLFIPDWIFYSYIKPLNIISIPFARIIQIALLILSFPISIISIYIVLVMMVCFGVIGITFIITILNKIVLDGINDVRYNRINVAGEANNITV